MSEISFMPTDMGIVTDLLEKNVGHWCEITYPKRGDIVWYYERFCEAKVVEAGRYLSGILITYEDRPIYVNNEDLSIIRPFNETLWDYALVFNAKPPDGFVYKLSATGLRVLLVDDRENPPLYAIISEDTSYKDNSEFLKIVLECLKAKKNT